MKQLSIIWKRLRKPSVILSLVSQVAALCMLFGFQVNESLLMSVATAICAILGTLGIFSNPDTQKSGYGDDMLICSATGALEQHVMVNGKMVCKKSGAVYRDEPATEKQETQEASQDASQ